METSLHRELKKLYASGDARLEVRQGCYRIDVVAGGELVEIQHGSLAGIRDKVRCLLEEHRVRVVKPIVAAKRLVKLDRRQGRITGRRMSPRRGTLLNVFDELIYFTGIFPHPQLWLDVLLVDIEEWRYPGHGRRRRYRPSDYQIQDQTLSAVRATHSLHAASDLWELLPGRPSEPFDTSHLAERVGVSRWTAQRIAYCLRQCGAAQTVGKAGNAWLYARASGRSRKAG